MFHVGIEGRTGQRDEAALDSFLATCGVSRHDLSAGQQNVLRSYCRKRRLGKWLALPMVLIAGVMVYAAGVGIPRTTISLSRLAPIHCVVIDHTKGTQKQVVPDPQTQEHYVQVLMKLGAVAGAMGMGGSLIIGFALLQLFGNWHLKALRDFLRVDTKRIQSNRPLDMDS